MRPLVRPLTLFLLALTVSVATALDLAAQRGGGHRPPPPPRHDRVIVSGHVFIGGYFYDPFWGPYPWWMRTAYPYWYFPVYDRRAAIRIDYQPEQAAVYVDGFYAGIVDDFDGVFQSLPLTPGGHTIAIYLEGYRTVQQNLYLHPGSSFRMTGRLEPLRAGDISQAPPVAPPVPPPPGGSYTTPSTPPPTIAAPAPPPPQKAIGFGTLDVRVQPPAAELTIDGQRWATSEEGHFAIQVPAGMHRIEVTRSGYQRFAMEMEVRDGETTPLNVSLMAAH